jgi:hypothetical protein
MKRFPLAGVALLLSTLLLSIASAQEPSADKHAALLTDFAAFDRAYVPALALTKRGTLPQCRPAMGRLKVAWQELSDKHADSVPSDPTWKTDFGQVAQLIEQAEQRLAEDDQQEAHEQLEGVRELLMKARRRNGIDYYLDYLTIFHDTMEKIVMPATAKAEKGDRQLSPAELAEMRSLLQQANQEWQTVTQTALPTGLFPVESAAARKMIQAEQRALRALEDALNHGDEKSIISAAQAIKPPFARLFMAFGDFPGPPR